MPGIRVGCLIAFMLWAQGARAEEQSRPVRDWHAAWGDVGATPGGETWRAIEPFSKPPGEASDDHVAWYRVTLPEGSWRDPALFSEHVTGAIEVWWDGRVVGGVGQVRPGAREDAPGSGWMLVPLPLAAVGEEVRLRVQSSTPGPFGLQRSLVVGNRAEHRAAVLRRGLDELLAGTVLAVAGLVMLLAGAWRRTRGFISFGLFSLVSGIVMMSVGESLRLVIDAPGPLFRLLMAASAMFVPALSAFLLEHLPQDRSPWFRRFQQALTAVGAVYAVVALSSATLALSAAPVLTSSVLVGLAGCIVVVVRAARDGVKESRPLIGGLAALFLGAGFDVTLLLGLPVFSGYVLHWGMLAMVASFGLLLAMRAREVTQQLEEHARRLEQHQTAVRAMGTRVAAGATQLLATVSQLTATSQAQSHGLTQQASALQETQVTAEEIKRTSEMASQKSNALLEGTTQAEEIGRDGEVAIDRSIGGLEAIGREVSDMARHIGSVEERTREIAGIIETVKELADQSNMLALNAAIEAVRSGEHGKGFAVVAREVRRLADQSLQAVTRIQGILGSVVDGIHESVQLSARGEERVATSIAEMRDSAGQLQRLGAIVRETGSSVRQISAAVSQQNAGVVEIFAAIDNLSRQMDETLERVHEAELAAGQVRAVAESLTDVAAPAKDLPAKAA